MTREELFMVSGVDVYHGRIAALLGDVAATDRTPLSFSDTRMLVGNGQHVPSVGLVLLWSLASTRALNP